MKFETFAKKVKEALPEFLPENLSDATIDLTKVTKNNDTVLTGITVKKDEYIAPVIYLEQFYEEFSSSTLSVKDIARKLADIFEESFKYSFSKDANSIVMNAHKLDIVSPYIKPRLINLEKNKEYLNDKPHKIVADLAVIYYIELDTGKDNGYSTIPITNTLLESYGIDVDDLHGIALENMIQSDSVTLTSLTDKILEMQIPGFASMSDTEKERARKSLGIEPSPMYYLSNNGSNMFGAAVLLDVEVLKHIRAKFGGFYILPSSVHEVLIVPKFLGESLETLQQMVREVNQNVVDNVDILSDNVYSFNLDSNSIRVM
jgi:hypothetical protein